MAKAHAVDVHVGKRLRDRRVQLGKSQSAMGNAVDLTFQQIQKYERGSNRIGAGRLFDFAKVLDVPVSYFFDDMPAGVLSGRPAAASSRRGVGEAGTPFDVEKNPLAQLETRQLVQSYYAIPAEKVRKRIFEMVKAVGAASHADAMAARKKR
jgi:transcriptional regulator with XRE-family HTH domain